jgi:small subunit ribosomal protein S15
MSRPLSVSSLRSALPSIRPFQPTFLPQAPASSSSFSTTSPALASRTRILAKRKKAAHIAKRAALLAARNAGTPDHILGYVIPDAGPSRVPTPPKSPWDGCRLQRTLLRPDAVYSTPAPDYPSGASPGQYLPGLSKADQDILFGALPHAATELALFGASEENHTQRVAVLEGVEGEQRKRTEMLQRILDLRNASKKGIEVVNRQRVIEEFGRKADGKGMDTGSSQVQGKSNFFANRYIVSM